MMSSPYDATFAHEVLHCARFGPVCLRPRATRPARVHQRLQPARHEAIVDEAVLLDCEFRVSQLQFASPVVDDVGATLSIESIRGTQKLSQNKSRQEIDSVIAALKSSQSPLDHALADRLSSRA